jgi:hypothetical protein
MLVDSTLAIEMNPKDESKELTQSSQRSTEEEEKGRAVTLAPKLRFM